MQAPHSQSSHTRSSLVSLGQNHGYRFEGDTAILNAELAIGSLADQDVSSRLGEHWALQLWACETPHEGGPLRGIKVAEAALALPQQGDHDYLETSAFAQLPPAQRAYSMVLVLASGSAGTYDQVHDFSNYPARQQFAAPHLEGSVGYRFEGDALVLQAEGVNNPRAADNLSGSLSLQLWALREPYAGGAFEGVLLGSAELDRLAGQSEERGIERRVALAQAPAGEWQLALMLREWTEAAGYLTRDFCNFANAYRVESSDGAEPVAPVVVETYSAQTSDEQPHELARHEQPREQVGAAAQSDDSRGNEPTADAADLAAERAEEQARQADLTARAEAAAQVERAAQKAEASARAEKVAREAELAERAIAAAREAESAARTSAAARAATARAQAEAEARAAMAVRAGKPAPVAKTTRVEAASAAPKATASASGSAAKKAAPQAVTAAAAPAAVRVSVQTASVEELAGVPGLNKKLAAAIVRARPFTSLDDLRQVRGIGDKMLQQLRASLTL